MHCIQLISTHARRRMHMLGLAVHTQKISTHQCSFMICNALSWSAAKSEHIIMDMLGLAVH